MNPKQIETHPLIGQDVLVYWNKRHNNWHAFTILSYFDGWILLRGRRAAGQYKSGDIMVPIKDIKLIETDNAKKDEYAVNYNY